MEPKTNRIRFGVIIRLSSFWVGGHWSMTNRRLCVNLIPCVTFFVTMPQGDLPKLTDYPHRWLLN